MTTNRIYGFLLVTGYALLLTACNSLRQEVSPAGFGRESQKLVVTCFIAPGDSTVVVRMTRSQPILDTTTPASATIANALVTFSNGSQSVTLRNSTNQIIPSYYENTIHYDGNNGYSEYRASTSAVPIRAGQTYHLRVEVPGSPAVEAECTVPGPVALSSLIVDSVITSATRASRTDYFVRLRWTDPASQDNFYRVAAQYRSFYMARLGTPPRDTLVSTSNPVNFEGNVNVSDAGRNGLELISASGRLFGGGFGALDQPQIKPPTSQVIAQLLNVDANYYRYHDAVYRQRRVEGNPFAEPVPIPTNIRGGLGCFGAYNRSTLTTELK